MRNNNDHIAEGDMLDYFYPRGMNLRDKFFEYVFPWIILAGICFGLYMLANYGLEGIVLISGPLSEAMKKAGL